VRVDAANARRELVAQMELDVLKELDVRTDSALDSDLSSEYELRRI
jgi:hypothetical protein